MNRTHGPDATERWHCQGFLAPGEHATGVRVTLSALRHTQLLAGVSKLSSGGGAGRLFRLLREVHAHDAHLHEPVAAACEETMQSGDGRVVHVVIAEHVAAL